MMTNGVIFCTETLSRNLKESAEVAAYEYGFSFLNETESDLLKEEFEKTVEGEYLAGLLENLKGSRSF